MWPLRAAGGPSTPAAGWGRQSQSVAPSSVRSAVALPRNPGERGRAMTAHKPLPNRRPAETFELTVGGVRYVCTVGRFADGRISELFLLNHKSNGAVDTNARDAAAKPASTASRRIPRVEGDAMHLQRVGLNH